MTDSLDDLLDARTPEQLTGGGACEGPVWHSAGYLTFTRHRLSQLVRWDPDGATRVIRDGTGEANGCALDRQGRLLMCEGGHRRVTRTEADGSVGVLAERWQEKRFNRPNDVVCRSDGTVFFTDPQGGVRREDRELGFSGVFRVDPAGGVHLGVEMPDFCNGLAFTPDEATLYVAITRRDGRCVQEIEAGEACPHRRILAYDVAADGTLGSERLFFDMTSTGPWAPDGMKVDADGRVWCTGADGIWVIGASGMKLGVIRVPEMPRNLAFGGPRLGTLFITAGDSLYGIETKVQGR
jgi:gluconolactonase